jgi:transposase
VRKIERNDTIGIDISKDKLDAYWLSNREHGQFCNDRKGLKALALWAREAGTGRVIFEGQTMGLTACITGLSNRLWLSTGSALRGSTC